MAEAAQSIPTFKLVLVGDGGTGKVGLRNFQVLLSQGGSFSRLLLVINLAAVAHFDTNTQDS
jgi:hypothetical protein